MSSIQNRSANTIKGLAMDAVQAANSGHPGAPMGMADIATALWAKALKYDPSDPSWPDRDRVVLSNGHASMLLYSMLHLTGTSISIEDIKQFRQWGSITAGHPEYGFAPGIETTTGPLGQGVANGVGMAMAERWLAEKFGPELVNHHTYVLTGDGCLMEGIAAEAASLAGHLKLGKLIVLYDDNQITIDGGTDISFSENVAARFEAYGWQVQRVDGHDQAAIGQALDAAKADQGRPSIVCCRTVIANGSPNLAGQSKSHGAPLGDAEIAATKIELGMDPNESFVVPEDVRAYFQDGNAERRQVRLDWEARLANHPKREEWGRGLAPVDLGDVVWPTFENGSKLATRKAGHAVLQALAANVDNLIGGSADLAGSNGVVIQEGGEISADSFSGRNINWGVREHAMAAACNGLSLHGGVRPFCATFLVFHDYMRPSVRLSALMHQSVVYLYSHDSIFVGEDGPTHQPIEQLMAMRGIPNLWVFRPADAGETVTGWKMGLEREDGPMALCVSRQGLPVLDTVALGARGDASRGGYILAEAANGNPQVVLGATGSEGSLALEARESLEADGIATRVVSLPCWELFDEQDLDYRVSVLGNHTPKVSIEAGITMGWERYTGLTGAQVGINRFGASAPGAVVAKNLGLNIENIANAAKSLI